MTSCLNFNSSITVPKDYEFIKVNCSDAQPKNRKSKEYKNVYFLVQKKPEIEERFQQFKNTTRRAPSILILVADGVGRLNLLRTMPQVANFTKENNFYNLKGFTKVGGNTKPNAVADLMGLNETTQLQQSCQANKLGYDKCPFVWFDFQKYGYATSYMEDMSGIATFNYDKNKGFKKSPVDYYGRTGIQLMEEIEEIDLKGAKICAGNRYIVDYVYKYGLDVAELYKEKPYFGIMWTNSLTHNYVTNGPVMDEVYIKSLEDLKRRGILEDSIVILLSDHGCNFNIPNNIPDVDYDKKLPMAYISLPPWFKQEYPEAAEGLKANEDRLTSPYDMYLTFRDILRRSGRLPPGTDEALGCPKCQSLFKPVPIERTCTDAGISDKYCACDK